MSNYTEQELIKLARQAIDESWNQPDFGHWCADELGDDEYEDYWCMIYSRTRDSGLMQESNYEAMFNYLKHKYPNNVADFRANHWACGWIEHLCVRALTRKGKPTKIFEEALEITQDLRENYPVFDDSDYSNRGYKATLEAIYENSPSELYWKTREPDEWEKDVFSWLWDNNQEELENRDDQGAYPATEAIGEALLELGFIYKNFEYHDVTRKELEEMEYDELVGLAHKNDVNIGGCLFRGDIIGAINESWNLALEKKQFRCKQTMEMSYGSN